MKCKIELDKLEYYPGEVIKGNLKITPASKIKVKSILQKQFIIKIINHHSNQFLEVHFSNFL